ncbi:hypothetical protein JI435_081590, partial [Parastagonospora nodorum SN15]
RYLTTVGWHRKSKAMSSPCYYKRPRVEARSNMPYPQHQIGTLPEQSDPKHLAFSVDRSTTVHTVFTMIQLDGSCESKVDASPMTPNRTSTKLSRKDTSDRPSTRKRLSNFFTSRRRTSTNLSNLKATDNADVYNSSPLRVLSPRATDLEPEISTAEKPKRRSFTFKSRQSTRKSTAPASATESAQLTLSEALNEGGHIPVTDAPCLPRDSMVMGGVGLPASAVHRGSVAGLPVRRDSVAMGSAGMPGSPMKEAALTSHPVILVSSESSDEFTTPTSGRSVDLGKT